MVCFSDACPDLKNVTGAFFFLSFFFWSLEAKEVIARDLGYKSFLKNNKLSFVLQSLFFWDGFHYIVQSGINLMTLLLHPSEHQSTKSCVSCPTPINGHECISASSGCRPHHPPFPAALGWPHWHCGGQPAPPHPCPDTSAHNSSWPLLQTEGGDRWAGYTVWKSAEPSLQVRSRPSISSRWCWNQQTSGSHRTLRSLPSSSLFPN